MGRYPHKVAIGNSRIQEVTQSHTRFGYKDYKQGGKQQTMTLSNEEFVRRFAQHILPHQFVRIRHFGFLSSTWKRQKLAQLQRQLKVVPQVKMAAKTLKQTKKGCTASSIPNSGLSKAPIAQQSNQRQAHNNIESNRFRST